MRYLYIIAFVLIIVGAVFDIAYFKRKRTIFDEKCNDYFVVSRVFEIVGVTLLVFINSAIVLFNL